MPSGDPELRLAGVYVGGLAGGDWVITGIGVDYDKATLCRQVEWRRIAVPITGPSSLCYFSLFSFAGGF